MTHSESDRQENLRLAFRLMLGELDDKSIAISFICPDDARYSDIYKTTWKELETQDWIEPLQIDGQLYYRLTGSGWLEAHYQIGSFKLEAVKKRMGEFAAFLKSYVKGRQQDKLIPFSTLVEEFGFPGGWIFNAIESALLKKSFGIYDATWVDRGLIVRIPLNFGISIVDHTADIRAELDSVQEELEEARERLSEVTCSYCGAPIVAQGSFPVSEHDDGDYTSYACGRYESSDGLDHPCPLDPDFPKLEEYELVLKENSKEPVLKWSCIPKPKTRNARLLGLRSEYGCTEEEAKQRVVDRYNRAAKPWSR
jgi:hypothetical protein